MVFKTLFVNRSIQGTISRQSKTEKKTDGSLAHPQQQKKEDPALKMQKAKVKKKWERTIFLEVHWVFLSVCWIWEEEREFLKQSIGQSQ